MSKNGLDKAELLPSEFFARDTVKVARELLGKILTVRVDPTEPFDSPKAKVTSARIVETEAYRGSDPASHSARGETPRSSVMFGEPGRAYVYFIYGMYEMLNFVTEPKGKPGAVLIRAVEPLSGEALMSKRRKVRSRRDLTSGPGKLCLAMDIARKHNGQSLQGPELFVSDDGYVPAEISISPRVGITQGKDRLWRFYITGNPFVSRVAENSHKEPTK